MPILTHRRAALCWLFAAFFPLALPSWAGGAQPQRDPVGALSNPIDPAPESINRRQTVQRPTAEAPVVSSTPKADLVAPLPAEQPTDFERLATAANRGIAVRRFSHLLRHSPLPPAAAPARVPPDHLLQIGDEISLTLWGDIDVDLRMRVDALGRITLPRVGPLTVAGTSMSELEGLIRKRLSRVFKGFEMSVALTDLSPVRVRLAGFVQAAGTHVFPPLTTLAGALQTLQGQMQAGSHRRVSLRRGRGPAQMYDYYQLSSENGQQDDPLLQAGDTIYVHEAGPQVAVIGSVNRVAIYEMLPDETVADLLRWAGGFSPVAERQRIGLLRISRRYGEGADELLLPRDLGQRLENGDLLHVLSHADLQAPSQLLHKRVRVDGEVKQPGEYLLRRDATLADAVAAAGGLTEMAFPFGTELKRESVRRAQEANYRRALSELESEIDRSRLQRGADDQVAVAANATAGEQLLERLRRNPPDGRIVLDIETEATALPTTLLEDGDRINVPPRNRSIGVFGSVYNAGSFEHRGERTLGDYLRRAGGSTDGGNTRAMFVVRANGSVVSASEQSVWRSGDKLAELPALPGDTLFVPERLDRSTLTQTSKDWTQILYQFGLGIAALLAIK